jgi:hypothetical protein
MKAVSTNIKADIRSHFVNPQRVSFLLETDVDSRDERRKGNIELL